MLPVEVNADIDLAPLGINVNKVLAEQLSDRHDSKDAKIKR